MTYMHLQASAMKYRAQTFPGFSLMESRTPRHEKWADPRLPLTAARHSAVSKSGSDAPCHPAEQMSLAECSQHLWWCPQLADTLVVMPVHPQLCWSAWTMCIILVIYTCMHHEEGTKCKHMFLAPIKVWYAHVPPQSFSWHHSQGHPHLQCNTWHVHTTDVLVNWWS